MTEDWRQRAECRGMPTDWWFPDTGKSAALEVLEAKEACARCQVTEQCLAYGNYEPYGIWGGLAYKDRQIRRRVS